MKVSRSIVLLCKHWLDLKTKTLMFIEELQAVEIRSGALLSLSLNLFIYLYIYIYIYLSWWALRLKSEGFHVWIGKKRTNGRKRKRGSIVIISYQVHIFVVFFACLCICHQELANILHAIILLPTTYSCPSCAKISL